jgi:hypothetical protein
MTIPAQQIGGSQESKLLWNISKQLEQLIGIMGKIANNTAPVTTTTTTTTAVP